MMLGTSETIPCWAANAHRRVSVDLSGRARRIARPPRQRDGAWSSRRVARAISPYPPATAPAVSGAVVVYSLHDPERPSHIQSVGRRPADARHPTLSNPGRPNPARRPDQLRRLDGGLPLRPAAWATTDGANLRLAAMATFSPAPRCIRSSEQPWGMLQSRSGDRRAFPRRSRSQKSDQAREHWRSRCCVIWTRFAPKLAAATRYTMVEPRPRVRRATEPPPGDHPQRADGAPDSPPRPALRRSSPRDRQRTARCPAGASPDLPRRPVARTPRRLLVWRWCSRRHC